MHALNKPGGASHVVRAEATDRLHALETRLTAHGFEVAVDRDEWSLVVGAEVRDPDDPAATILREQRLQLGTDGQRQLRWYLTWPTGLDKPVQYATLCAASAIAEAVERVARLLADHPAAGTDPPAHRPPRGQVPGR